MARRSNDMPADVAGQTPATVPAEQVGSRDPRLLPVPQSAFNGACMIRQNLDKLALDYATSLPCATADDKRVIANVLNVGGDLLSTMANVVLSIVHVTVCPVDYVDKQTGEETPGLRVILTTANRQHYSCGGMSPVRAIRRLCAIYGPLPFNPPIRVKVKAIQLADGKSTYTLEVM